MALKVFGGNSNIANVYIAMTTATFASMGFDASNIFQIFQVGEDGLRSWMPDRDLNPIEGTETGKGYYIYAKEDMDISEFFETDGAGAGGSGWNLTGNSGTNPTNNFVGTSDNQALAMRVNNLFTAFFGTRNGPYLDGIYVNNIFIGTDAGKLARGTAKGNIAIGTNALSSYTDNTAAVGANVAIGPDALRDYIGGGNEANVAVGFRAMARTTTGIRTTAVGLNAAHNNTTANFGAFFGAFAGEWQSIGQANTAFGFGALRNNTIGIASTAIGPVALENQTGQIRTINVTNGGSGYTFANVTVTPYDAQPFGFLGQAQQCLATATIDGGVITAITVTQIGRNYSSAIVTIDGDGAGATAVAVLSSPDFNVALGGNSGWGNQIGKDNVFVGVYSGYDGGGDQASTIDDNMTFVGNYASRDASVPTLTKMTNATAIGYKSKVGKSNALVLGGVDANRVDVGIGTVLPSATLHVAKTLATNADDITSGLRLTNPNAATVSLSNRSASAVFEANGWRTTGAASTQVYAQQYLNTISGSASPSGRLTFEVTLPQTVQTTKLELVSGSDVRLTSPLTGTSLNRFSMYNNSNVLVGQFYNNEGAARMGIYQGVNNGFIGFETVATADGNQIRGFVNNTGIGSSFAIFAGASAATACAILEGASTTRGFLPPRMTSAQRVAIAAPVAGLQVYDTDLNKMTFYNGTAWEQMTSTVIP